MGKDLVSIVVPIYNVEPFLERCLCSIVNQTYQNLEIILVDDGSPDNCPQICDDWAKRDARIRVIHKENAGLGMARNTGIEHATGEYICFFDSDDYIDLMAIEKAHALAITESADIVYFGSASVDKQGIVYRECIPKTEKLCFRGNEVRKEFLPDLIDYRHAAAKNKNLCLSACFVLYSMDLIKRVNWRFVSERENISEDSYSLIHLYKFVETVAIVPETLYFYCENGTSLTRIYRKDRYEKIKQFYFDCTDMAKHLGYDQEILIRISGVFLSLSLAAMKQITTADMYTKEKKRLLKEIIEDETMQSVLADPDCRYKSRARKILFFAMRAKAHQMVYCLVKLQARMTGGR